MRGESIRHGQVGWRQLVTTDVAAAALFYGDLLGWTAAGLNGSGAMVMGPGPYRIAGIREATSPRIPSYWDMFIALDDVDLAAKQTEVSGGTVLSWPADTPGVVGGRCCRLADPQGAAFTAISYGPDPVQIPPHAVALHGAFSWAELMTADPDVAKGFYADLCHWRMEDVPMGKLIYTEARTLGAAETRSAERSASTMEASAGSTGSTGGTPIEATPQADGTLVSGIMAIPAEMAGAASHWGSYVTVDDVDVTAARVSELGGRLTLPPIDVADVGRLCMFTDPQGASLAAITYTWQV